MEDKKMKAEASAMAGNKEKKKLPRERKPKDPADRRRLANGSYALAVTAIAIAVIVVINFIVSAIPSKFTTADVSTAKLYTIDSTTKKVLNKLDDDITLYYLTESGQEDATTTKLLETYEGYSSHIKYKKIDIVANPTFASKYTSDTVSAGSIIAVCGDKSKVINYSSIYPTDSSSYYSGSSSSTFDGEGQITSAIAYLTSESSEKVYYTTGHNELDMSTAMPDAISKANLDSESINLLSADIPSDCSMLIIFSPLSDFTTDEVQKVKDYLADGGHLLLVTMSAALTQTDTPNLDTIMASYGVTRTGGYLEETDQNYYASGVPYLLVPKTGSSTVTSDLSNENIVDSFTEGLTVTESEDAGYTVTPILTTSDSAELVTSGSSGSTSSKGEYDLAVEVDETLSNDSSGSSDVESTADSTESTGTDSSADSTSSTSSTKETKILYYASPFLFSSDALSSMLQQSVSLPTGNTTLFSSSLTYLTDSDVTVSVASKSTQPAQTTISSSNQTIFGNLFMFVIPVAVIIVGFTIWFARRRK